MTVLSERRERIEKLRKMLSENKGKSYKDVLTEFCLETGVKMRTASEYLDLLTGAGIVKIEDGIIKEVS